MDNNSKIGYLLSELRNRSEIKIPPPKQGNGIIAFCIRLFYRWKLKIELNTIFEVVYAMRGLIHGKDLRNDGKSQAGAFSVPAFVAALEALHEFVSRYVKSVLRDVLDFQQGAVLARIA